MCARCLALGLVSLEGSVTVSLSYSVLPGDQCEELGAGPQQPFLPRATEDEMIPVSGSQLGKGQVPRPRGSFCISLPSLFSTSCPQGFPASPEEAWHIP